MKNLITLIISILFLTGKILYGQEITGTVINKTTGNPVEYVNIGIEGKCTGTVSDQNGNFRLNLDTKFNNDTLLFSSIGYFPRYMRISELRKHPNMMVKLNEKTVELEEVVIRPKVFKQKTLGVTSTSKAMQAGFDKNLLGYECGVIMKNKKTALIKKIKINIARCSYDTVFYRLNIYKVHGENKFENILHEPVYIKMPKELVKDEIQIDLEEKNLVVSGNFLVTLEHVKDLGDGNLYFCAGLSGKTYYRKTSQAAWESVSVGVSISVIADVEK